jgi:PAS domain-containing protein
VSVVPWYAGTQIAGYSGSAVDVTERVEIEERLSAQRDFSALLLEISPLPISLVDEQDHYITVNQAWEAFRGLRREDVIGCSTVSLLGPAELPLHEEQRQKMLRTGQRIRYEAHIPPGCTGGRAGRDHHPRPGARQ